MRVIGEWRGERREDGRKVGKSEIERGARSSDEDPARLDFEERSRQMDKRMEEALNEQMRATEELVNKRKEESNIILTEKMAEFQEMNRELMCGLIKDHEMRVEKMMKEQREQIRGLMEAQKRSADAQRRSEEAQKRSEEALLRSEKMRAESEQKLREMMVQMGEKFDRLETMMPSKIMTKRRRARESGVRRFQGGDNLEDQRGRDHEVGISQPVKARRKDPDESMKQNGNEDRSSEEK